MNISELSQGELMFYSGIVMFGLLFLLSLILIFLFKRKRKKLLEWIEDNY